MSAVGNLTPARVLLRDRAVRLREEGKSVGQISYMLGQPKSTVWDWVRFVPSTARRRVFSEGEREWLVVAARELRAAGLEYREIGERIGVSPATAWRLAATRRSRCRRRRGAV